MSLNVIQAAIDFHAEHSLPLTFIPSRRQVDHQGGYVANLTMERLRSLVGLVTIERDHGGPQQGTYSDNGWDSLAEDAKWANIIHIDPWKAHPDYEAGLDWTVAAIMMTRLWNPTIRFEVGTEESIRRFEVHEVDVFLQDLETRLPPSDFAAIDYVVIQCGTSLKEGMNTGAFDAERLRRMLEVVTRYGKQAKEHNGDWISRDTVVAKGAIGLRHINIAPELGEIESRSIYNRMDAEDRESFYDLCWKSRKWEKWVTDDFDPPANKERLVLICGHYVFSHPEFLTLKAKYPGADQDAQHAICARLNELYGI